MSSLFNALPIIVNNYSRLFGVQVRMQGMSAYTNGKVITIPRLDLNDAVISRYAYGYLAHEAAHVRYTSFRTLARHRADFLEASLINILEDARVERLIGREFIGVWENLNLIRSDEKSWQDYLGQLENHNPLQLILGALIPYLACYSQRFDSQRPRAAFLLRRLRRFTGHLLLGKFLHTALGVLKAKKTGDVCRVVKKLIALLGEPDFFRGEMPESPGTGDTEPGAMNRFLSEMVAQTGGKLSRIAPGVDYTSLMESMAYSGSGSRDDFGCMQAGSCRRGRADFITQIRATARLRRLLRLRLLAYIENFGGSAEKGRRLCMRRAAMLPYGEKRIFRPRIKTEDYSTSVHILVDVSGSMMAHDGGPLSRCEQACISALSLAMALENIDGVTTLTTFFPGWNSEFEIALDRRQKATQRAAYFDQQPRGSTPLAQALWYAIGQCGCLDTKRNIVVVITDGIPDSVEQSKTALTHAAEQLVEVYGIGIKTDFITNLISDSAVISESSVLADALFSLLFRLFPAHV